MPHGRNALPFPEFPALLLSPLKPILNLLSKNVLSLDAEAAVLTVPSQERVNGDLCGRDVAEGGEGKSGSRDRMAVTAP